LTGRFVEEDCGGSGGVEGFDAAGHGDADTSGGAAFDFFGKACAFVADEESDGFAPVDVPGSERGCVRVGRGGESANLRGVELSEKNWESGAGEDGNVERCSCGGAEGFGGEGAGGAALAGGGGNCGGGSEGCSGAEHSANVAGILDSGENDEKRCGSVERRAEYIVERKFAWFDKGSDTLGMFGVGDAFEESIGGVENREGDFFAVEIGGEAGVMAATGFGEENGFDAAAGREGFLGEANAFDADRSRFCGKAAAEGDTEFLEPAIFAGRDDGIRSRGFAGGRHDEERNKFAPPQANQR